ncbi:MAG: DUF6290 family protein [Clostridiales Family XIII bacterium]|jgi:hypothetical protein|nr:DUF6290 family protein [Clostridiales Family XIII bacterium]
MYVSMRVTPTEKTIMKEYAEVHGITVSQVVKKVFFEHLEDELDIKAYENYLDRKAKGDVSFVPLDEFIDECGLSGEI